MTQRSAEGVAALALLLAAAGACSSPANQAEPALPEDLDVQPSLRLECDGTTTAGPPENFSVLSDSVALPSSPNHPALQTSQREASDGSTYFFAKTGLIWKTGSSFELVVPDHLRPRMAIGWGGPAPHGHAVEMRCDGDGEERWVARPGGYWVTEPLCADLLVRTEDEEVMIQIGLGTPCDDQEPPQGPSDGADQGEARIRSSVLAITSPS